MKIVRISKGKAVSLPLRLGAVAITIFSIIKVVDLLSESLSIFVILILCCFVPAIWFATNVIIINEENKTIFDGIWTMGKKLGKPVKYNKLEEVFIEKIRTKKTVYSLPNKQNIISDHEYRAYLKLSNGKKYFLLSHPLKNRIEEKVTKINKKLELN